MIWLMVMTIVSFGWPDSGLIVVGLILTKSENAVLLLSSRLINKMIQTDDSTPDWNWVKLTALCV